MTDRMSAWERIKYRTGSKAHLAAIQDNVEALAARAKEAEADRDRARSIAVALEQENASLESIKAGAVVLADARLTIIREQAAEIDRYRAEAHAAHGVIEQAGLMQEYMAEHGHDGAETLRQILDGAQFGGRRNG